MIVVLFTFLFDVVVVDLIYHLTFRFLIAVPGQPTVHPVNIKANSIELTWIPPTEPNGVITFYELCWRTNRQDQKCDKLNHATRSYEIPSLRKFAKTNYSC